MSARIPVCLCIVSLCLLPATTAYSQSHTWTTTTDFSAGFLHHTEALSDELRIDQTGTASILPYVWVACTQRNTVVRIATATTDPMTGRTRVQVGDVLGDYYSAPDCCRAEPKERLADMPAVIERIELARTILSSRTPEAEVGVAEARVEAEDEIHFEHTKEMHAAGFDPVAEALGLKPDGHKAIDFDDSTPVG